LLNDEDFNDDKKDAGEMGSGHNVTALYELIPLGSDERIPSIDPLKYQPARVNIDFEDKADRSLSGEYLTIKLRYKRPDGETSRLMEKAVRGPVNEIEYASENLRFAAAVSEFGMLLRASEYKGTSTMDKAINLASGARGEDEEGYRAEFIRLIRSVRDMKMLSERD
jgi:Ca-activated chloride channel family protein